MDTWRIFHLLDLWRAAIFGRMTLNDRHAYFSTGSKPVTPHLASGPVPPRSTDGFLCGRGDWATGGGWCWTCLPSRQRLSPGRCGDACDVFFDVFFELDADEASKWLPLPFGRTRKNTSDDFALVQYFSTKSGGIFRRYGISMALFQCLIPAPAGIHCSLWPLFGAQQTHALRRISARHAPWWGAMGCWPSARRDGWYVHTHGDIFTVCLDKSLSLSLYIQTPQKYIICARVCVCVCRHGYVDVFLYLALCVCAL